MMSLGNNNFMHMAVSNENNVPNSQETTDVQTHTQGQFPTYSVVTSTQTRVSQVLTTETSDVPVKSPVNKTSIISVVKGTGNANQQIFVQKSPNESSNDGQSRSILNDSLIHPRTPGEEASNVHFIRKNNVPSRELQNESPSRTTPSDSHVVHHTGNSMAGGSFSPNMSMNNQAQAPPPYVDATSYTHRDITHSSFQRQSPFELHEPFRPTMHPQNEKKSQHEVHESSRVFHQHSNKKNQQVHELARSPHQQSDKKSQQRHESSRPHQQAGEKQVHVIHESPRSLEQQGEHQHQQQLHPSNRTFHQQGDKKGQLYESSRTYHQHNDQKTQQKHEAMRPMQQREANRVIQKQQQQQQQQHGEHKGQQLREPIYHGEQKSQKIHYQLSDQKTQQMHLSSRPMYIHADQQKSPQLYETSRQLHQHGEQKGQQIHESGGRPYQHNDQKKQHQHDSSRMMHQHNDQKNQQIHESSHQPGHHSTEQQKKQHESSRSSDQKSQQKNVHKFHHGNARVKYVEFKPIQEGMKYRQMMHHSQHSYNPNLKQTLYYSNHVPNNPGSHHLTVQTQSHSPLSPLHSPPALRPPPTIPSGTAWHSPPSLVPSPEVRPRFDFISSPQPVTTAGSPHPVQVANMVHHKAFAGGKGNKQMTIPASHNILLPRLPGNYLGSPGHQTSHANIAHVNVVPRSKANFNQTPTSNSPGSQPVYDNSQINHSQSGIPVSSVATTVTVTMTYIPIPTSTKDKFVYVPVNSGQPVVLYQNQQPSGKPVILPQQMMQPGRNVSNPKDNLKDPSSYTTVRLQGLVNCGKSPNSSTGPVSSQNSPMKSFKYHFANTSIQHGSNHSSKKSPGFVKLDQKVPFNMNLIDLEKEKYNLTPISTKDMIMIDGKQTETSKHVIDNKNQGDVMTLINSQLRLVPPQVGVNSQATNIGMKRNNMGVPISNSDMTVQSPISTYQKPTNEELTMAIPNDTLSMPISDKDKKKRGRPPTEKMPRKARRKEKGKGKLSPMQGNLLTVFSGGQSNTNEALIEAYKKQQQILLQKHYFEEPLLSLPDLPPTPESWTCEDVHRYLLSTDCSIYADAIKAEEIDGKSFLLLTREALMDFLGIKLGPALKISGHAASLRARQRVYCLTMQQQEQKAAAPPKEKKIRLTSKVNQKQSDPTTSNSLVSEDSVATLTNSCSSTNEDSVVVSTVESVVPTTELIIPNISLLSAPSEEKKPIKPILEPLLVTERSPVILKVPNPLSIILGENNSTKPIETIELNGETPEELHVEDKGSANFPVTDEIVNNDIKSSTDNLHLSMQNITNNKFEFSSKPLLSSTQQIHTLTEIEPDGITTHENS